MVGESIDMNPYTRCLMKSIYMWQGVEELGEKPGMMRTPSIGETEKLEGLLGGPNGPAPLAQSIGVSQFSSAVLILADSLILTIVMCFTAVCCHRKYSDTFSSLESDLRYDLGGHCPVSRPSRYLNCLS